MNKIELLKLTKELCGDMPIEELIKNTKYLEEYLLNEDVEKFKEYTSSLQNFMKYIKILNPKTGLEPISIKPKFNELCDFIKENKNVCINSYRQAGLTTFFSCYILYNMISKKDHTIVYMSSNENSLDHFMEIFKIMYENLPVKSRPGISTYNKRKLSFDNGSKLIVKKVCPNSLRGLTINELIIDTAAFVPWKETNELFANIIPTMSTGDSKIIIGSSPNYNFGFYYDIWNNENFNNFVITPKENMTYEKYNELKNNYEKQYNETRYNSDFNNQFIEK